MKMSVIKKFAGEEVRDESSDDSFWLALMIVFAHFKTRDEKIK